MFYCYYSETFPRKREYQYHTNHRQDFNPLLNRAELILSETQEPDLLRVEIDTETPCFETFVVQVDEGAWRENPAPGLEWRLHEGLNRLRVKARNTYGGMRPGELCSRGRE